MTDKNIKEFTNAARNGDLEKVKEFVKNGLDVNAKEPIFGFTALIEASDEGHSEVVKYLTEIGADVNIQSTNCFTALIEASSKGHSEVVKHLLEIGADVSVRSTNGWTALLLASDEGHSEIIKYLVAKGADINDKNPYYSDKDPDATVLMKATRSGDIELVKYLIENGADTSNMTIINWVNCGSLQKVKECIENGANPNQRESMPYDDGRGTHMETNTLLINASIYGHIEIVKYLLECGADSTLRGFSFKYYDPYPTALDWAIKYNHIEIIKLLKDADSVGRKFRIVLNKLKRVMLIKIKY